MKKKVLVLGCTGSVGKNTLEVIREFSQLYTICGLSAHSNKVELEILSKEFNCPSILTSSTSSLEDFIKKSDADICVNAITGSAGLLPSVLCLMNGINLALANKESIVMAGSIIKKLAIDNKCTILPVDSEHAAIFSLIDKCKCENIHKIIITASGGPFKDYLEGEFNDITPEQALKHPTWNMGKKISIDSATLANKGLEVIEACRLFDISPEQVEVTIHPQSLIHSLVETLDGDVYAQISKPNMKRPILQALSFPEKYKNTIEKLHFSDTFEMSFSPPNRLNFPMLGLAYDAQKKGGAYTIAFNASNEIAVELFLDRKIKFLGIAKLVSLVLDLDWNRSVESISDVFSADKDARDKALDVYKQSNFFTYRIIEE